MKRLACLVALLVAGCAPYVPTMVTKTTTIEKDAEGKVLKRTEMETVIQQASAKEIRLEFLKVEAAPPETGGFKTRP